VSSSPVGDAESAATDAPRSIGRTDVVDGRGDLSSYIRRGPLTSAPAARLLQQRIQTVLEYASDCGWRPENSRFRWSMIAELADHEAERRHPALMPPEEHDEKDAALIVEAVRRLRASDSVSARCLEFVALTAVRIGEGTGARWGEFNWKTKVWTIPVGRMKMRGKKRRDHVVPLSEREMQIVAKADGHKVNDFVFIGQRDGAPISKNTIRNQCDRVTGGRASPHGWRATFRSWAASQGISFEISEICLAHAGEKLQKAYMRGDLIAERRRVMELWSRFLSGEDAETGNVVSFAKRA
jgi:integrase